MLGGGVAAGAFGSLLGLGGGILIVPLLTLGFGLPLREAVGVSLVCVIVTSSAAAGVYLERHVANLRLGMTLELFTAIGALVGGSIAFLLDEQVLSLLFAVLLALRRVHDGPLARRGRAGDAADGRGRRPRRRRRATTSRRRRLDRLSGAGYRVRNLPLGIVGSTVAGVVSALLGIGGGIVKVPVMHLAMGVPLRVATATSNLMIGITASASAIIYLIRGGIDPYVAGPTAIGVFLGATAGSRLAHRIDVRVPAAAVRRRPALHGLPDAAARAAHERRGPPDPGLHRRAPQRPPAHRVTYVSVGLLVDRGRADGRRRHLAAGRVAGLRPGDARRVAPRPGARRRSCGSASWPSSPRPSAGSSWPGVAYAADADWLMVGISIAILLVIVDRRRHGHRWTV